MKAFFRIAFLGSLTLAVFFGADVAVAASSKFKKAKASETVVLLHGLGRNKSAMWLLSYRLKDAGYKVERIGYRSLSNTPEQILLGLSQKVNTCCASKSQKVHFVGHSFGGLLIRAYLARHRVKNLGHVVLIGTPNNGTQVVDAFKDDWWFKLLGPVARSLGTGPEGFSKSLPAPDYPLGVIAGKSKSVLSKTFIPGDDDGVVPVDSTRVEGMADFVVVNTGHSTMRYNRDVARYTIRFLKSGQFRKTQSPKKLPKALAR